MPILQPAAAYGRHCLQQLAGGFHFAVDRMSEPETWGGIVTAVYTGSQYQRPFNWIGIGISSFFILKKSMKRAAQDQAK